MTADALRAAPTLREALRLTIEHRAEAIPAGVRVGELTLDGRGWPSGNHQFYVWQIPGGGLIAFSSAMTTPAKAKEAFAALAHPPEGAQTLSSPVAQSPEQSQQSAHEAGDAEGAPEERPVSNRCSAAERGQQACVLASAPGDDRAEGAQTEPAGWKWVPIDPTPAMWNAAVSTPGITSVNGLIAARAPRHNLWDNADPPLMQAWRAMLAAAPKIEGALHAPSASSSAPETDR